MIINNQNNIKNLLQDIKIPQMIHLKQNFASDVIGDVAGEVARKLREKGLENRIRKGMRVAITAGSRGIDNIPIILREVVNFVKENGGEPYLFAAMGSHGGSTAEGQLQVLHGYGITEEACGCPIHSSMETVLTGHTKDGLPVYIDKFAADSDAIIVVGRIKPHTGFRGPYESGLAKMLSIGMGKQKGADSMHNAGFGVFKERVPAFAEVVLLNNNVIFGVGLIENAFDKICRVEVCKGEEILEKEPPLLEYAKSLMPRILFSETDVLIVREIGKNFAGAGMDANITGTWATPYASGGIKKQRTVVLDLSDESQGNAFGVGLADMTTFRLFNKIDFSAMYPNPLTSTVIRPCYIPMFLETDEMAIKAAIKTCNGIDREKVRVIYIKNTSYLSEIFASAAMIDEIEKCPMLEIIEGPRPFNFDESGNLIDFM